jgi:hypothetical protein
MASADEPYAGMRVSMKPGQMVELDGSQRQSIGACMRSGQMHQASR